MRVRPVNPGRRASTRYRARRREARARRDHSQLDLVHFEFDESHACGLRWRKRARRILRSDFGMFRREKKRERRSLTWYRISSVLGIDGILGGIKSPRETANRLERSWLVWEQGRTGAVCQRTRTICNGDPHNRPARLRTPVDGTAETARCSRRARRTRIASGVGRAARGPRRRLKITA